MSNVSVGVINQTIRNQEEILTLQFALTQLSGEQVEITKLPGLAGTNDILLWIAGHEQWLKWFAAWAAFKLTDAATDKIAGAAVDRMHAAARELMKDAGSPFRLAIRALRTAAIKGEIAGVAVEHPRASRKVTLIIRNGLNDEVDFLWLVLSFARCADKIYFAVDEETRGLQPGERIGGPAGVEVEIRADGSAWMFGRSVCAPNG